MRRLTMVVVIIAVLLICFPLGINGYRASASGLLQHRAKTAGKVRVKLKVIPQRTLEGMAAP